MELKTQKTIKMSVCWYRTFDHRNLFMPDISYTNIDENDDNIRWKSKNKTMFHFDKMEDKNPSI